MPAAAGGATISTRPEGGSVSAGAVDGKGGSVAALKALVIGMGVLIVAGTVTLAILLVQRLGAPAPGGRDATVSLGQPEGARISGIAATDRALAIWVSRPDGERVILLDPAGLRRIGEIRLTD
jgi:hypothetical protein